MPVVVLVSTGMVPGPAAIAATSAEDRLARQIAERLCYLEDPVPLPLSPEAVDRFRAADRLDAGYRDIQGADARARFVKIGDRAECRRAAAPDRGLFLCAPVTLEQSRLVRGPASLCR